MENRYFKTSLPLTHEWLALQVKNKKFLVKNFPRTMMSPGCGSFGCCFYKLYYTQTPTMESVVIRVTSEFGKKLFFVAENEIPVNQKHFLDFSDNFKR